MDCLLSMQYDDWCSVDCMLFGTLPNILTTLAPLYKTLDLLLAYWWNDHLPCPSAVQKDQ